MLRVASAVALALSLAVGSLLAAEQAKKDPSQSKAPAAKAAAIPVQGAGCQGCGEGRACQARGGEEG
jgi:hypothetical protein